MRSGHCGNGDAGHERCRMAGCSCPSHDSDLLEKAATLTQPVLPDSVAAAVEVFVLAAEQLSIAAREPGTAEDALRLLHRLRVGITAAQEVDASLVTHVYLHGEHGDVRLDGIPAAKVQRARDRKAWEHRGLAQAVMDAQMDKRAGEPPSDPWEPIEWLLDAAGLSYWRVTQLRALGIDPEAFCTSEPGKVSVQFIG